MKKRKIPMRLVERPERATAIGKGPKEILDAPRDNLDEIIDAESRGEKVIIPKMTKTQRERFRADLVAAFKADEKKEQAQCAKAEIYRGYRGNVGGPADNKVSKALEQMIGARIVDAGFIRSCGEGGLTIDFDQPVKCCTGVVKKMRLVLGYNDLGEWVKFLGERET